MGKTQIQNQQINEATLLRASNFVLRTTKICQLLLPTCFSWFKVQIKSKNFSL
jgi:hypothetical protein